jgi:hypothetical protein
MRSPRLCAILLMLSGGLLLFAQASTRPPQPQSAQQQPQFVRTWTIRETGDYKKIPTATLRTKMAQRGVLFAVNEPYDQRKVDGTSALLRELYHAQGVAVTVVPSKLPAGTNFVKIEYVIHKQ